MKKTIAKHDWLTAQECLGKAWYELREGYEAPTEAELFRMEQGQEVGKLARELYPGGILVSKGNSLTPAEKTRDLCANVDTKIVFEATVSAGPFVAKADILTRESTGWHVLEVKSKFSDTKGIKEVIDDLSYTVMVFRRAATCVARASLVLLSRDYRFGDATDRLFKIADVTNRVNARVAEFEAEADDVAGVLLDETKRPAPTLVAACRDCASYKDRCLATGIPHTVLEIPRLHYKKLERLSRDGIVDVAQLPNDLALNDCQQRARSAMLSGNIEVEPAIGQALQSVKWPCHYLDFETVATVLPLYKGHGCHRQIVTQFSIHHRDRVDAKPRHSEYLADPARDCERELAESLIASLGDSGSIIVYSPFEKTRITALRNSFADLQKPLDLILGRLQDFEKIIENNVYHPEFRGSFSIKTVLPALVPELSYASLDVKDGDTAITRFARMAKGQISGLQAETTRKQLLEYCEMDTLAMVKLHEALEELAAAAVAT